MELIDKAQRLVAQQAARGIRQRRHALAGHIDFAGGWNIQPTQQVQQRALAGAGRTDDRHRLASGHGQVQAIEHRGLHAPFGGLRRLGACCPPGGIQGGQEAHQQRDHGDRHHVAGLHVGRQAGDVVHVLRHQLDVEHRLDGTEDAFEVEGQGDAADQPGQGAEDADQRTLHHEHLHHPARGKAEGAQDRDIGLLVGDQHHLRGHQVERTHRDDQRQQDAHHHLLHAQRVVEVGILLGPVTHTVGATEALRQVHAHLQRAVHVVQLQPHAGGTVTAQHALQVLHVGEADATVDLVIAGFEDAADGETLHPRHCAGRRALHFGEGHQYLVADVHAQPDRQLLAQQQVEAARLEAVIAALGDLLVDHRHLRLQRRVDALDDRALDARATDHRLDLDVRRGTRHARVLAGDVDHTHPVRHRLAVATDGGVRGHLQQAAADFLLETAHHGQGSDQHRDAERDAQDRCHRDEGDEAVAALGAQVAQADRHGDGFEHAGTPVNSAYGAIVRGRRETARAATASRSAGGVGPHARTTPARHHAPPAVAHQCPAQPPAAAREAAAAAPAGAVHSRPAWPRHRPAIPVPAPAPRPGWRVPRPAPARTGPAARRLRQPDTTPPGCCSATAGPGHRHSGALGLDLVSE
ncbi:hypothetical protein G6F65_013366 [Rhizopus arrhizus]|nr:hypothetical protein G6F65_013366 [Rhizopus arrhizus]